MGKLAFDISKHMALREFEGYIQIVNLINKKAVKIGNYKYSDLFKIKSFENETDIYYTPNTNYNGKRGINNLKQLRSLYLDFDVRGKKVDKNDINYIIYETWLLADRGEIPKPTKALITGRGIHIYWDIEPSSYGALMTWQELEDFLYNKLKFLGADKQATDAARLMRLEGSLNSKTGTKCEIYVFEKNNIYNMYNLREEYLNWNNKTTTFNKSKNKKDRKVINLFTSYSLHMARADDIVTLVRIRNYDVKGYRNFIIHCYAYWKGIYVRNSDELKEIVFELNESFKAPLKDTEVNAVLKCIPKAIDKFLDYEQGIRSGKTKRVSKNMRERGGYWYKNSTLIERLNITVEEMDSLKTIISTTVKNKRFYEKNKVDINEKNKAINKKKRRNKDGLTKKQQELKDLKIKILSMKEQNLSNIKIAEKLGFNKSTIGRILKRDI